MKTAFSSFLLLCCLLAAIALQAQPVAGGILMDDDEMAISNKAITITYTYYIGDIPAFTREISTTTGRFGQYSFDPSKDGTVTDQGPNIIYDSNTPLSFDMSISFDGGMVTVPRQQITKTPQADRAHHATSVETGLDLDSVPEGSAIIPTIHQEMGRLGSIQTPGGVVLTSAGYFVMRKTAEGLQGVPLGAVEVNLPADQVNSDHICDVTFAQLLADPGSFLSLDSKKIYRDENGKHWDVRLNYPGSAQPYYIAPVAPNNQPLFTGDSSDRVLDGDENSSTTIPGILTAANNATSVLGFDDGNNVYGGMFNGPLCATDFFNISDARVKDDILDLTNALDMVKQLTPRQYRFNAASGFNIKDELAFGFLAQELEKVYPQMVREVDLTEFKGGVAPGTYKVVDYQEMIPVLTRAIQEQQDLIEQQQAQIDALTRLVETTLNKK